MSELGATYRFAVENKTGQTLAANSVKVYGKRWKFATDGTLTLEVSEATLMDNGSTIANATFAAGSSVDNTTDKYLGGEFIFSVTVPTSSNGDVVLYIQRSTDGGTRWPDNANYARRVSILNFTAAGTKSRNFSI